jgi:hypothetical protein
MIERTSFLRRDFCQVQALREISRTLIASQER